LKNSFYRTWGVVLAIVIVVTLIAVSISRGSSHLSERCVQALVTLAKAAGTIVTSSGDRIWIGGKEVRLKAQIENEGRADASFLAGLRVDVLVNGAPQPLSFGAVGMGKSRDEAVDTAVSEWAMSVGEALLGAFGVKTGTPPQDVGPFLVYAGLVGIRGAPGVVPPAEVNGQLLPQLATVIKGLESSPSEFHSISLMLVVKRDGPVGGECRVDGTASPAALAAAQSIPWSWNGADYMFKQSYVLRRR
jgi:hypothetical protein